MRGPGDGRRFLLTCLFAAWVMAFGYAFYALAVRPVNIGIFLGWQGVAGALAVAIFGVSRPWPRGAAVRRMGVVPLSLALVLVAGIAGVRYWAGIR